MIFCSCSDSVINTIFVGLCMNLWSSVFNMQTWWLACAQEKPTFFMVSFIPHVLQNAFRCPLYWNYCYLHISLMHHLILSCIQCSIFPCGLLFSLWSLHICLRPMCHSSVSPPTSHSSPVDQSHHKLYYVPAAIGHAAPVLGVLGSFSCIAAASVCCVDDLSWLYYHEARWLVSCAACWNATTTACNKTASHLLSSWNI